MKNVARRSSRVPRKPITLGLSGIVCLMVLVGCGGNVNYETDTNPEPTMSNPEPSPPDAGTPETDAGGLNTNPPGKKPPGMSCWTQDRLGRAAEVKILASSAGTIHGFADLVAKVELLDNEGTFPASTPQYPTQPAYDFTDFKAGFSRLMMWSAPYTGVDEQSFFSPLFTIAKPGQQLVAISYFTEQEARDAFALNTRQQRPANVNGQELLDYAGLDFALTECAGGYYLASNGGNTVWQLRKNTQKLAKAVLPGNVSSLFCVDNGTLVATTLPRLNTMCHDPTPCNITGIAQPAAVYSVNTEDGSVDLITELPGELNLPADNITFFKQEADEVLPHGLRVAVSQGQGDTLLVADQLARKMYSLSQAGELLNTQDMPAFMTGMTKAPNGVVYGLRSMTMDSSGSNILEPAAVVAWNGTAWQTVYQLSGHDEFAQFFDNGFQADCQGTDCMLPFGAFFHLGHDWCNTLYASDPTGRVLAIALSFD